MLNPEGIRRLRDYPNLTHEMVRAGWPTGKIEKILAATGWRYWRGLEMRPQLPLDVDPATGVWCADGSP
jgi:hypothetical protein